jgi:glycosyltransferase involved in cell wall biosynthesis
MNVNFKIIIPVYNSDKWINQCIWSLYNQSYDNWEALIIDDASTDKTIDEIKKFMKDIPVNELYKKSKFRVLQRNVNVGALENIVYGINFLCEDEEDVIVLLDGDDALYAFNVLSYVNEVYNNSNIWLTYGQYIDSKNGIGLNKKLTMNSDQYRDGSEYWCTSHLRTFKYKIWKLIKDEDLRMSNGKYYSMAWDMAIMYPLIEMCGNDRICFIDKILYKYNDQNPLNDGKKNNSLQVLLANEIKNKPKYKIL